MEKRLIEKEECRGYIHKIIKSSIVDGPGNRLAIFMQGCNFDCWYCHNPETIPMKDNALVYTPKSLFNEVEKYFGFIDGITFSGGEALLQQEFIYQFCSIVKSKYDISCFIDTNASVEIDERLLNVIDYFMIDIKVVDNNEHLNVTKCSNKIVLKNFKLLNDIEKLYEVRTVIYPGYNHEPTIKYVEDNIGKSVIYKKIPFHSHGVRRKLE
ncbi:MAG: radical SAM protein [Bacilli bacterium]